MLVFLLSWILISLVLLSYGDMIVSVWNKLSKDGGRYSIFDTFFIGISFIGAIVIFLSLFFPLNKWVMICLIAISAIYGLSIREIAKERINVLWRKLKRLPLIAKFVCLLITFIILLYSIQPFIAYDFGLYHLASMKWAGEYGVVPGLANLHGRLGFNSSFLLLSTFFFNPNSTIHFYPINSLCALVFFLWLITLIYKDKFSIQHSFLFVFLVLALLYYTLILATTSTDVLANIITFVVIINSLMLKRGDYKDKGLLFIALPLFCVTLKISMAIIVIFSLLLLYSYLKGKRYRLLTFSVIVGSFLVLPWLIRNVVLSGYLVYPMAVIDFFDFDWKIPIELVKQESSLIKVWAIQPGLSVEKALELHLFDWIPIWFNRQTFFDKILYVLVMVSPLMMILYYKKIKEDISAIYPWCIAFAGCLIWFLNAPDPRFNSAFIVSAALIPYLIYFRGKRFPNKYYTYFVNLILIVSLAYFVRSGIKLSYSNKPEYKSIYTFLIEPIYYDYGYNRKNTYFYKTQIDDFLFYSTSIVGGSTKEEHNDEGDVSDSADQCYDLHFLSTPYLNQSLHMRGTKINDGFRITN